MSKMLRGLILVEEERVRIKRSFSFLTGHTGTEGGGGVARGETGHADKQGQLASFDEVDEEALL